MEEETHLPLQASPIEISMARRYPRERLPLNEPLDQGGSQSYRQSLPNASNRPFLPDVPTSAARAPETRWVLIDPEDRTAVRIARMHVPNSSSHNPKTVIESARGHDFLAFSDSFQTQEGTNHVPFHFSTKVRSFAKIQNFGRARSAAGYDEIQRRALDAPTGLPPKGETIVS